MINDQVLHFIYKVFFTINMLLIVFLYIKLLKKRNNFLKRVVVGVLLCLVFASIFPYVFIKYIIEFFTIALFCFFVCEISFLEALYCTAIAYVTQHLSYNTYLIIFRPGKETPIYSSTYILISILMCIVCYVLFVRYLPEKGNYTINVRFSTISICVILLIVLGLSILTDKLHYFDASNFYYICRAYAMLCCIFILFIQVDYKEKLKQQRELDFQEHLWNKQKELYELRKSDVDAINLMCHDLKHQVEALKSFSNDTHRIKHLQKIEESIRLYDSRIETGNKVLNTVLAEKNIICIQNHITMTCVADGNKLVFIDPVDLYTILGNALDNAIESVLKLDNIEKRIISVSVWTKSNLLLIKIENYFENKDLVFHETLPVTTKQDREYHGFGLKSIRYTIEKYDGCMGINVENNLFILNISIPINENIEEHSG